jgi:hypothetical protein
MVTVVLISCVSQKAKVKSLARDMYISTLFKKSLKYTETVLKPDKTFILSAEYHLLDLEKEISPYNKTLNSMNQKERHTWATNVLRQLNEKCDTANDKFIFLAGKNYYECLIPHLKHYEIKMEGLQIGKRLQWLTDQLLKGGN